MSGSPELNSRVLPRQLVLLTQVYPFSRGEEFLEAEIPYLAHEFDRVLILPISRTAEMPQTRQLPENVAVIDPLRESDTGPHILLAYARRRPVQAFLATLRAVASGFPKKARIAEDLKFDLVSHLIAERYLAPLAHALDVQAPTVFYSYWLVAPARVALALRAQLRMQATPVVSRAHGYDLYEERSATGRLPQRQLLLDQLREVYPVSQNGEKYLETRYPKRRSLVVERNLGVTAARKPGEVDQGSKLIYSCSSIIPLKRLDLLIAGIAAAQQAGIDVRWCHVGSGPSDQVDGVQQLASEQLLPNSYSFAGALSNQAVRELYSTTPGAGFVNVSSAEGIPVSIMEALAQGLPVVATDVGGTREILESDPEHFPGLLPNDPSPEEVAQALTTLLRCDERSYTEYSTAAVRAWSGRWSAETNYSAFAKHLAHLSAD